MKAERHTNASLDYLFSKSELDQKYIHVLYRFWPDISEVSIDNKYFFSFQLFDDEFPKFYPFIALVDANHFIQNGSKSIDIQVKG